MNRSFWTRYSVAWLSREKRGWRSSWECMDERNVRIGDEGEGDRLTKWRWARPFAITNWLQTPRPRHLKCDHQTNLNRLHSPHQMPFVFGRFIHFGWSRILVRRIYFFEIVKPSAYIYTMRNKKWWRRSVVRRTITHSNYVSNVWLRVCDMCVFALQCLWI